MTRLLASLLFVAMGLAPALAFDTPTDLIKALYTPYAAGDSFDWNSWDETQFRSVALQALFDADAKESDGVGRLDFDPYIDGQDYQITELDIGEPVIDGDTAQVAVTFKNFATPDALMFYLVKEDEGWKVDDVVSSDANFPYSLKAIMSAPLQQ